MVCDFDAQEARAGATAAYASVSRGAGGEAGHAGDTHPLCYDPLEVLVRRRSLR